MIAKQFAKAKASSNHCNHCWLTIVMVIIATMEIKCNSTKKNKTKEKK